jgi:hypothetical protein
MNGETTRSRFLTPSLFAVGAIVFLLPFFTVSCTGPLAGELRGFGVEPSEAQLELTGWDLVLGQLPERFQLIEGTGSAQPLAIALAVAVVLGIVASGLPRRLGAAAGVLLGLAGILLLILLGRAVGEAARANVQPNARGFIHVSWEIGAWVLVALLAVAALHGVFRVVRARARPP